MSKKILTESNIAYIKRHRFKMSGASMALKLGVSKGVVNRYMKVNGLSVDKATVMRFRSLAMSGRTTFSKDEDDFISENYLALPVKTLAAKIGRSFTGVNGRLQAMGLVIPNELTQQRKEIGRIKPGNVSFNKGKKQSEYMSAEAIERTKKTRFQPGQLPHNTKEKDGTITIRYDHSDRSDRRYKYIRISLGKWYPLHQHIWEKKNGKVPKKMCLWFKDGNSLNCDIGNLELITRSENMARNSIQRYPKEMQTTIKLISKLNKKVINHEQQTIRP